MHIYERWIVVHYLASLVMTKAFDRPPADDADLVSWLSEHGASLGLPPLALKSEEEACRTQEEAKDLWQSRKSAWRRWRSLFAEHIRQDAPRPSRIQKRISWLVDRCGLSPSEGAVLGLVARISRDRVCAELVAAGNERLFYKSGELAFDLGELRRFLPAKLGIRDLREGGLLTKFGLLDMDPARNLRLTGVVETILAVPRFDANEIRRSLLSESMPPSLGWNDFEYLGRYRDLAARIVAGGEGMGVNILLYGPPGTGKSEFAKTLGALTRRNVHFVGEQAKDGEEPRRQERVAAMIIANELGAAVGNMLVVVDEADDLFAGVDEDDAAARRGSKAFMNRLVERTRVPTIWITNDVSRLGPAVIRRMNLVLRFPRPSEAVRRKIVERTADRASFQLDDASAGQMARLPAAPALIHNAICSAARIQGSGEDALAILACNLKAMGYSEPAPVPNPIEFDVSLSRADVDLRMLSERATQSASKALSFCLSGPPGTGKSAYARYLASKMQLEPIEKRYSNLVSKYLGDSEKAIAYAFEEAADIGAFLIIDEADSLLRNRADARHSWEITQVNEMLTWMERHPLPFACTTNAVELLDPATTRRFLFKVRFLPMAENQISIAFQRAFGSQPPASLLKQDLLTPGDFSNVARKAELMSEIDPVRLAQWLEDEVAAKPAGTRNRIGF